ncbi:quinolinate synthetase [Thermosyntropha lipolytica DSM 11003]|uniref:Quinolinate synthase n=1 Tax=Thermosyntropha lipolytica DSM 11003 TaxID=1123382 RepID=A0A1M5JUR2_9FIRM|nr:quinolinate synthase NadA [Thermosyntropha lipolytica]SHG44296.1 quinolinate synthetase [Thermosyntropha lipolytica DSM 11003]
MSGDLTSYIAARKKELNALILAHYYQLPEIQDCADFVGDSLQLARRAKEAEEEIIVCCGVHFMAESAKILNPDKTVLIPEVKAGCPMADMVTPEKLREKKALYGEPVVVCYVNSSAAVKAESDICCTSSNALEVVRSIPEGRDILFVPDCNLGAFVAQKTGRELILWEGYCPVHHVLTWKEVEEQKKLHPEAEVVVHPECPVEVTEKADAVRSTAGILKYVQESPKKEFIIGTEAGFLYTLHRHCPDKKFYLARPEFTCADMKLITLEKLALALEKLQYEVVVPEDIREKAYQALEKMIAIG